MNWKKRQGERRMGQVADWHTAKVVTIGQLIVLLGTLSGGIWYLARMETAQGAVEADVARHERELVEIRRDIHNTLTELKRDNRADTSRLEGKLDDITTYLLGLKRAP